MDFFDVERTRNIAGASMDLLATKLFIPPARSEILFRSRLSEQLNPEILKPFTLISAPAGYGKTTLLSTWAASCGQAIAWVSLDAGDNDPIRFWRYVDAAIQSVDNRVGQSLRSVLFSTQPPAFEQVITGFVNDIMASGRTLILALEDYHVINNAEVHASVNFLLDNAPPNLHVMITTRSDPPLHLALRRGRGQVGEIRAADLRFVEDEIADFINGIMQLGLADADIEILERRTEGWITGLHMAALSLKHEADRHGFVTAFSGDDRHIADYLMEEVLQRQSLDFQRFLLQTSIFEQMSAPLCNAVLERQDSQAVLDVLERTNLFIQPLDNHREWFRYHHLFAELLRRRLLQSEGGADVKTLQRRTVDWFRANGYFSLALAYALNVPDMELACDLIIATGRSFFTSLELNTLLNLGARLPSDVVAKNGTIACMLAWAAQASGHPQKAEQYVRLIENRTGESIDRFVNHIADSPLTPEDKAAMLEMAAVCARIAMDYFDVNRAFHIIENILPYFTPERDHEPFAFNLPSNLYGPMVCTLGLAQKLHGDIKLATQTFMDSTSDSKSKNNFHIVALSLGHLGETQAMQGYLHDAQRTFNEALNFPSEVLRTSSFFGMSYVGLGNLAYEWNDLDKAMDYLQAGIKQGKLWSSWECLLPGYSGMARLHAARQEWEAVFNALDELQTNTSENQGIVKATVESLRALLNLWRGDLTAASLWAENFEPIQPRDYVLAWENDALVRCRIWIARGEFGKAERLLDRILPEAKQTGRNRRWLEAMCLLSILFDLNRRHDEALDAIRSVLDVAEPEGYIRLFVDEGETLRDLLSRVLPGLRDDQRPAGYVRKILSAFEPVTRKPKQADRLIEALTEREIEVLRYIAEGCSNPEIARRLYLSPNTLKAHSQNIFTKLDVHNRLQAVNKARELGLID